MSSSGPQSADMMMMMMMMTHRDCLDDSTTQLLDIGKLVNLGETGIE